MSFCRTSWCALKPRIYVPIFILLITVFGCAQQTVRPQQTSETVQMNVIHSETVPEDPMRPFYGMEFVPIEDLDTMREFGIDMILAEFRYDEGPEEWLAYLDAAHACGIRVIPWLWPQGWSMDQATSEWTIDDQARLFLQTVADHPATFAVYGMHEPYWNGCQTCGYTTPELQALYQELKAIADVPIYSEMESFHLYSRGEESSESTVFADGICDYCNTNYYPFFENGVYERDILIERLEIELQLARELAPQSEIIWTMQTFEYDRDRLRMPTAEEMRDLASLVYATDIAGAFWYPWTFDETEYSDFLSRHPELFPTIREVYETTILPLRESESPKQSCDYRLSIPLISGRTGS
jgi:hypothetical protein